MTALVLAAACVGAILVLLGIGRREVSPGNLTWLPRKPWLIALALLPQLLWSHWLSRGGAGAENLSWLVALSYLPLGIFLVLNRRHAWTNLIAIGVALNVAVMVANGGAMPAPARFATLAGADAPVATLYFAPGTKDRVVGDATPVALDLLADRYVIPLPGGRSRLASIGDFFILAGALTGLLFAWRAPFSVTYAREVMPRPDRRAA